MIRKRWLFLYFFSWMIFTPIVGFSDWWSDHSPYIFEGKVVSQYYYFTKEREIRTCSTVKICKIFSGFGSINLGTVNVITDQSGCIGDLCVGVSDGGPSVSVGHDYLFFTRDARTEVLVVGFPTVNNTTTLEVNVLGIYEDLKLSRQFPKDNPEVIFNNQIFKTRNEFYNFLKSNYALSVQAESSEQINNPKLQTTPDTVKVVR